MKRILYLFRKYPLAAVGILVVVFWIFAALFILLGMIAMCIRILRYLEHRAGKDSTAVVQ